MKFTSLLLLLVVLASCGTESVQVEETPQKNTAVVKETTAQINAELESLEENIPVEAIETQIEDVKEISISEDSEAKVQKVQAVYENPKQEVYIDMEYTLDDAGKISEIKMTDTNYDQNGLQENLQVLIGKSIDEVDETSISGGSLTIPAVKKALSQG